MKRSALIREALDVLCPRCGGSGSAVVAAKPLGRMVPSQSRERSCRNCDGTGKLFKPSTIERLVEATAMMVAGAWGGVTPQVAAEWLDHQPSPHPEPAGDPAESIRQRYDDHRAMELQNDDEE